MGYTREELDPYHTNSGVSRATTRGAYLLSVLLMLLLISQPGEGRRWAWVPCLQKRAMGNTLVGHAWKGMGTRMDDSPCWHGPSYLPHLVLDSQPPPLTSTYLPVNCSERTPTSNLWKPLLLLITLKPPPPAFSAPSGSAGPALVPGVTPAQRGLPE